MVAGRSGDQPEPAMMGAISLRFGVEQEAKGLSGEGILCFNTSAESTPWGKGRSGEASREAVAITWVRDDNPRGSRCLQPRWRDWSDSGSILRLAGFTDG